MGIFAEMVVMPPEERERILRRVGYIDKMPSGPAKWREIATLVCDINPEIRTEFAKTALTVQEKRGDLANKLGFSKNLHTRHSASLPVPLLSALYSFEPELKLMIEDKDRNVRKRWSRSLVNAFPEFKIA